MIMVVMKMMVVTYRAILVTQLSLFYVGTSTVVDVGFENW